MRIFKSTKQNKKLDISGISLILISSALLGIWAVRETILFRNILLVLGSFLSLMYCYNHYQVKKNLIRHYFSYKDLIDTLPITLIGLMFFWIILHYIFFSQFPEKQWYELKSTWLRAFLGSIIGFACSIALRRNPFLSWILWIGLIISYLVLIYQYVIKSLTYKSLFVVEADYYIYLAKFNGVLAGIILFAGTLGLIIDNQNFFYKIKNPELNKITHFKINIFILLFFFGTLLPLYSFVFIFASKNGIGVMGILIIFWVLVGGFYQFKQILRSNPNQYSPKKTNMLKSICLVLLILYFWLFYHHIKQNPGWGSLIEDISISVQIDKYQHWINPSIYGLPKRIDGSNVASNTYERVALATVGLRIIAHNPVGNGLSRSLPSQMKQIGIDYDRFLYTHSGWLDFGLSFGLPGMLLIPIALTICLIRCPSNYNNNFRATTASLAISLIILFCVGEYSFQHSVEILLFMSALIAGLSQKGQKNSNLYRCK